MFSGLMRARVRSRAMSAAWIAVACLVGGAGGCASAPPAVNIDQLPVARTIRNSASVEYQSIWSDVSFFARSNETVVEVVDPTAVAIAAPKQPQPKQPQPKPSPAPTTPASTTPPSANEQTAQRQAAAPQPRASVPQSQSSQPPPPPPPTQPIVTLDTTQPAAPPAVPVSQPESKPPSKPTGAIGKITWEPKRGGEATSDSRAGAASRSVASAGKSSTESQSGKSSSAAGIGAARSESSRGGMSSGGGIGATTRQFARADKSSSIGIGTTESDYQRGQRDSSIARGDTQVRHLAGEVTGSRAGGQVAVTSLRPDMTIEKHTDRRRAASGYVITYTLTIRNSGPLPVASAIVRDEMSADLELIDIEGAPRIVDRANPDAVSFRLPAPLPPRSQVVITLTTRLRDPRRTPSPAIQ